MTSPTSSPAATSSSSTSTSSSAGGADGGTGGGGSGGGVVAGAACGSDKLVPLHDNFTNDIDLTTWTTAKDDSHPVFIDSSGGLVSLDIPLGPTLTWGGVIVSSARYDMRNCAVFMEAKAVPADASVYMNLVVKIDPDKNFVEFTYQKNVLQFKYTQNGVVSPLSNCDTPYKAAQHRYWKIRVDSGTTNWEASPDAKTWTTLCSKKLGFPYENVFVGFGAGTSAISMPADGGATDNKVSFDNFNVVAP